MVCFECNYDYWVHFSYEIITLHRSAAHILTPYPIKRELMSLFFQHDNAVPHTAHNPLRCVDSIFCDNNNKGSVVCLFAANGNG